MNERPLEVPFIAAPVADTHAHLDMLEDPAGALARAAAAGVTLVVTVVDLTEDPERTFSELPAWLDDARARLAAGGAEAHASGAGGSAAGEGALELPAVRIILGAHPHNAKDASEKTLARARVFARDDRVVGIGEIGLDYHYDYSPRDVQQRVFAEQLALAAELGLPAIVHLREAHEDGEGIMREVGLPRAGCVLHCFTGDRPLLERFLRLGCLVSFAGPVTFKKAEAIREAAAAVPLDRILVETDCPFMAPEPYRGRKNEPALTVFNAMCIAEIRKLPVAEFALASTENARRLFGGAQ